VASIDLEVLARTAYDAFRRAQKGAVPPWDDIPGSEQQAWRADKQTHVFSTDFTAGRQGSLVVADDHASNHHARFQFAHGAWYVEDLKSTNGTWLNNRRMFAAQRLKKGDKIKIGRTVIQVISA
jgi:hypothetical protein